MEQTKLHSGHLEILLGSNLFIIGAALFELSYY